MKKQYNEPTGAIHAIDEVRDWPGSESRSAGRWDAVFAAYDKLRVDGSALRVTVDNVSEASRCATAVNAHAARQNCKALGWRPQSSSRKGEDGVTFCYLRKTSINKTKK